MTFLENENLLLRALEPEDLDILYAWENNTELWKYGSTLMPYSKFALRDYLANSLHGIVYSRQLRLMAVEKESLTAVGMVDLFDYDPIHQRAGVGILVDTPYRRKGYGAEILNLTADYAFHILHINQLYAHIPLSNTVSFNLLSKCGYEQSGVLKAWLKTATGFEDVHLMQLMKKQKVAESLRQPS
ncbi:MAG: GNAT family N-acetyltransferase [Candidatus Azobacteroides sp.]|nr:GNAT family N-acetyltransferase [Candidatus Azobacteroides sp.]